MRRAIWGLLAGAICGCGGAAAGGVQGEAAWSAPVEIGGGAIHAAIDDGGDVIAVFPSEGSILATRYDAALGVWQGPERIGSGAAPLVAMERGGHAVAAWEAEGGGITVATFDPDQGLWTEPEAGTESLPGIRLGGVELDERGNVALAWTFFDEATGRWDQSLTFRYGASGSWHEQAILDASTAPLQRSRLVVEDAENVRVRVVWLRRGHLDTASAWYHLGRQTLAHTPPIVLGDAADDARAELAVDAAGQEWVAFADPVHGLSVQRGDGREAWLREPARLSDTAPAELALAAGEAGRAALLFAEAGSGALWLSRWEGQWGTPVSIAGRSVGQISIALGAGGDGVLAWSDGAALHVADLVGKGVRMEGGDGDAVDDAPVVLASSGGGAAVIWRRTTGGVSRWMASVRRP